LGYSSYFALDITDPNNPQVLWEFSNEQLGFSTTGPAIVKIGAQTGGVPDRNKNGKWFVVFGSGPTGPIDPKTHQFKGYSYQELKVFILDLVTGQLLRTINSGINYAFAGSLVNGQMDFEQNDTTKSGYYQDEAVYFGFTKAERVPPISSTKWNVGGVLRLLTKSSLDPSDWVLSRVIENIGPVTAAVAKLQNYTNNDTWLFLGTGRYFFKIFDDIDDQNNGRSLYGIKEPCYSSSGINNTCTSSVSRSQLGDATTTKSTDSDGWYIDLDTCTNASGTQVSCSDAAAMFKPERNVTDPLATTMGAVFFTTTQPNADLCEFGGASHLWAVDYGTGGSVSGSKLRGKALMQVSTGSIEEVDLRSAFTEKAGRRSTAIQGVPPAGAPPGIIVPPPPVNRIFHIREK
jgi:type IV pilus assembly protein PilY1